MKLKKSILEQIIREEIKDEFGSLVPTTTSGVSASDVPIPILSKHKKMAQKKPGLGEELGHIALDVMGLIPGGGEVADGVNLVWYVKEYQQYGNENAIQGAVISLISLMLPGAGDMSKLAKFSSGAFLKMIKWILASEGSVELIERGFNILEKNDFLRPFIPTLEKAWEYFVEQAQAQEQPDSQSTGAGMTSPEEPVSVKAPQGEETV